MRTRRARKLRWLLLAGLTVSTLRVGTCIEIATESVARGFVDAVGAIVNQAARDALYEPTDPNDLSSQA